MVHAPVSWPWHVPWPCCVSWPWPDSWPWCISWSWCACWHGVMAGCSKDRELALLDEHFACHFTACVMLVQGPTCPVSKPTAKMNFCCVDQWMYTKALFPWLEPQSNGFKACNRKRSKAALAFFLLLGPKKIIFS